MGTTSSRKPTWSGTRSRSFTAIAKTITFMDLKDYSQFTLSKDDLENEWPYLTEGMEGLTALMSEGRAIGIELPLQVSLRIEETRPSVKGGSVTARTKPATLSTGLVVQVPEYMSSGRRRDRRLGQPVPER